MPVYQIIVKVEKNLSNEADPWEPPSALEVAAELGIVADKIDEDTGWHVSAIGA